MNKKQIRLLVLTVLLIFTIIVGAFCYFNRNSSKQEWYEETDEELLKDPIKVAALFMVAFYNQKPDLGKAVTLPNDRNKLLYSLGKTTKAFSDKIQEDMNNSSFRILKAGQTISFVDGTIKQSIKDESNCIVELLVNQKTCEYFKLKKIDNQWKVDTTFLINAISKGMLDNPKLLKNVFNNMF